jgi:hypothetical protein
MNMKNALVAKLLLVPMLNDDICNPLFRENTLHFLRINGQHGVD